MGSFAASSANSNLLNHKTIPNGSGRKRLQTRFVTTWVRAQHKKAKKILEENREKLDALANFLYERETITGEEFMNILNG